MAICVEVTGSSGRKDSTGNGLGSEKGLVHGVAVRCAGTVLLTIVVREDRTVESNCEMKEPRLVKLEVRVTIQARCGGCCSASA